MCGIVAYLGKENACPVVIEGLKRLEYRGYDSWGVAALSGKKIACVKRVGRISNAKECPPRSPTAIGHTRWATHGRVTEKNAHPHLGCRGKVAIAHNGIIENHAELRLELQKKGHRFSSQTDSEAIAHLVEEEKKQEKGFWKACEKAFKQLKGSFAVAALDADSGLVVGARKNSPLALGMGKGKRGHFLASDVNAFLQHTRKAVFLEDNETVLLGNGEPRFRNFYLGKGVEKKAFKVSWDAGEAEKQGCKHFMLKEIFEQPARAAAAVESRLKGERFFPEVKKVLGRAKQFNRIVLLGCGTAFHAGMVAEYLLERMCRLPVQAEYASEFRYRKPVVDSKTLAIAISQSGETADTLAAVREAKDLGAATLSIVNVEGSTVARESDCVIYIKAGPEIGVASTKAFTSQLLILSMLAFDFARAMGKASKGECAAFSQALQCLPGKMDAVLQESEKVRAISRKYASKPNALFLGRGVSYPIALEGALKLKEISYLHAEAMPAAEMKHGPIALIDEEMPAIFVAVKDKSYEKVLGNIEEVKARGGKVIAVTDRGNDGLKSKADETIFVPRTHQALQPIVNVLPLQLLAYYVADLRGCDIDKPRNLAKAVTVE